MHTNREHWLRRPVRATGALLVSAVIAGTSLVASAPTTANAVGEAAGGGYATSGKYADTIFWLDMSGFDHAQAKSDAGQDMQVSLAGGHTVSFNIWDEEEVHTADINYTHRDIVASEVPTLGGATGGALGGGTYNDIPGKPALMTAGEGSYGANLMTLRDIEVMDAAGNVVTSYALVGADAVSTDGPQLDGGETITWSSDVPINVIDRGPKTNPANPGGCPDPMPGEGTTQVLCDGTWGANGATLATVVSATEPSYLTQRLGETVNSRQAVAFGIMTSKVSLTKQVNSRVAPDDSFTVQATSDGNVLSSDGRRQHRVHRRGRRALQHASRTLGSRRRGDGSRPIRADVAVLGQRRTRRRSGARRRGDLTRRRSWNPSARQHGRLHRDEHRDSARPRARDREVGERD